MSAGITLIFLGLSILAITSILEIAKQLKRLADAAEKRNDIYCKKEGINRFQ